MARLMQAWTRRRAQRGIAAIEMAIVLPLFLLLMCGLLEYSWLFIKAEHIANSARQGARVGATADSTVTDIHNSIASGMTTGGIDIYTVEVVPADPSALQAGETFSVTVRVSYSDVELGLPLVPTPSMLETTITMMKEGP